MTAQLPSRARLEALASGNAFTCVQDDEATAMARALLEAHEQEPVAWSVGGIATHDKKWAERRSAEDNLLMEPLYRHPIITGIDENHYDPELEPGLYVAEIMTKGGAAIIKKGGAAIINGYYTHPAPAPAVPDEISTTDAMKIMNGRIITMSVHAAYKNGWNACRAAMLNGGKS